METIIFKEIWKPILLNYCEYEASNYGRIRRKSDNLIRSCSISKSGYKRLCVQNNHRREYYFIHRLVASLFVDNPNPLLYDCVNHKDENPLNNFYYNLEWCDREYNNNYGGHNYRISKSHSKRIIQYDLQGNKVAEWESATKAARELGYAQSCINWCCLRKAKYKTYKGYIWRYVGDNDLSFKNMKYKAVVKYDKDGKFLCEYDTITEAANNNRILITSIVNCMKGRTKTAGGYIWKLKE